MTDQVSQWPQPVREAAWSVQRAVHDVLSDVVTHGLRIEQGDRLHAGFSEYFGVLHTQCPEVVPTLLSAGAALHHSDQPKAVHALLDALTALQKVTGKHLPLPTPLVS